MLSLPSYILSVIPNIFQDIQILKKSNYFFDVVLHSNLIYCKQEMSCFGDSSINFSQNDNQSNFPHKAFDCQFQFQQPRNQREKDESLNNKQSEEEQDRSKNSNNKNKDKKIKKAKSKGAAKYPKRVQDPEIKTQMGRPDNKVIEIQHLKESKSYNDIIYHFQRFKLFLRMRRGEERRQHSMNLTFEQNRIINKSEQIMSTDNFPGFNAEKPIFLLHPNSPHYVMSYLKKQENKITYTSQEMKFILIAYLRRNSLLTTTNYHYLSDYWKDIIFLANNPRLQSLPGSIPEDFQIDVGQPQEMPNSQENNENIDKNGRNGNKKRKIIVSETEFLKKELEQDNSICAYEIACYLHACIEKYNIGIDP